MTQTEVVDPICLGVKVVEHDDKCCCCCCDIDVASVPRHICGIFDDPIIDREEDKKVFVSLGLFTIVRLERDVQLLIPVIDFCVPECECVGSTDSNPCELFDKLKFPIDEFFPPERCNFNDDGPRIPRHGCCE